MADATESKIDAAKADIVAEKAAAQAAPAVEATPVATPVKRKARKAAAAKPVAVKTAKKPAARKAAPKKTVKAAAKKAPASLKDTIMAKTQTAAEEFTARVKDAMTEAQDRAKAAFEKGNEFAGEYGEFAKGNIEALVESGKILAAGVQQLGKDYVAEGKSAFETMTADVKELAAVKSPADFFKLQGEILRRNFDAAVASGSKQSEKVVKLANDAFAPIQDRVAQAIDKAKKAA